MKYRVLIVDDEADSRDALAELTQRWGYDVQTASDGTEALRRAIEGHPDVILTDLVMPNMDGLWLLCAAPGLPECPVVLLTGRGTIQTAVQAIKEGAYDFIEKPLEVPRLRLVLERAREEGDDAEVQLLRRRIAALAPGTDVIGSGPAMQRVFELVKKVAPSNASVVIAGESGTGKEIVARAIHDLSPRKEKPFVAVNCGAIPATLIESELFGTSEARSRAPTSGGSATSSSRTTARCSSTRSGSSARAAGEVPPRPGGAEVPPPRWPLRGGGRRPGHLRHEPRSQGGDPAGRFREDLYFRLHVFTILLPQLKERREDIPLLTHHFIEKFNGETGKHVQGVSPARSGSCRATPGPGTSVSCATWSSAR